MNVFCVYVLVQSTSTLNLVISHFDYVEVLIVGGDDLMYYFLDLGIHTAFDMLHFFLNLHSMDVCPMLQQELHMTDDFETCLKL